MNTQSSPHDRAGQTAWALEDTILYDMPPAFEDTRTPAERRTAAEQRLADLTGYFASVTSPDEV